MNARRSLYIFVAAVLLLFAAGCSRARNDAQIAGDVVTKIGSDAAVPTKQITVTSNNGVVTLAGTVTSDAERSAAANDAAQVAGVKTVVNNLEVGPAAAQAQPAQPVEPPAPVQEEPGPKPAARHRAPRVQSTPVAQYTSPPAATPAPAAQMAPIPAAPPAPPRPVTIPDGTVLAVRMIDAIDTARNQAGDAFRATVDSPITIDDKVIVPQGAEIVGRVAELKGAGHFAGKPQLALELTSLKMNGRQYTLQTNQYAKEGSSRGKNTAAKVGGGAALGAIIGGIAGGGKGAAIGSVIGAGAGGGVQAATKAPTIQVPSEALLSFRLESPLTVTPVSAVSRTRSNPVTYSDNPPSSEPQQYSDDDPNAPVLKRRPQ